MQKDGQNTYERLEKIILADITKKYLDVCQECFKDDNKIEYHLIENNLDFLPENSIDQIGHMMFLFILIHQILKNMLEF